MQKKTCQKRHQKIAPKFVQKHTDISKQKKKSEKRCKMQENKPKEAPEIAQKIGQKKEANMSQ